MNPAESSRPPIVVPVTDLQLSVEFFHPADLVWRAVTEHRVLSEWFVHTDLAPVTGGVYRAFPPPGLPGFAGLFDVDVLCVRRPELLVMRWRGEELHVQVTWQVVATAGGCRLDVLESGFRGLSGDQRRAELRETYQLLFRQRLPAALERLAATEAGLAQVGWDDAGRQPVVGQAALHSPNTLEPEPQPTEPAGAQPWLPPERQMRLSSMVAAMIITLLLGTALAVLLVRPPQRPVEAVGPGRVPETAIQLGVSVSPSPSPEQWMLSPDVVAPRLASSGAALAELTATYRTGETFALGYIGSITITAGSAGLRDWRAVVELPAGAKVTSAWDQVGHDQEGVRVTFLPAAVHRTLAPGERFTFSFQVGGSSAASKPVTCAVDGVRCGN